MTRQDIKRWAMRNWWEIIVVIALPVLVWGARKYDAGKVDVRAYEADQFRDRVRYVTDSLHHARDDQAIRYLVCRQDFTRRECLPPERP